MIRLALFGQPVSHSPSPRIHGAFGAQLGLDVDYRLIEAAPEEFPDALGAFHARGGVGCNITLPLKGLASRLADQLSPRAELAGAANTLSWAPGGACLADNTDGEGLVRDLETNLGFRLRDTSILLLGAGGAAAGVLGSLLGCRPARVSVANRTAQKAHELAARHATLGAVQGMGMDEIARRGPHELVIDATSLGHAGMPVELPSGTLTACRLLYSLNYGAAAKPMGDLAASLDVTFQDGLGMLVEQAACSFEIWTTQRPDTGPALERLRDLRAQPG